MTTLPWLVPVSPNGYQDTAGSATPTVDAQFFGEDIFFDVSRAFPNTLDALDADYVVDSAGDWTAVSGLEALRQSLLRRLITAPGDWATKPDYGCGARLYVKAKNTESVRAELASRIKAQFARDSRVHSVDLVVVDQLDDGSAGVKIRVLVTPTGRLRTGTQLPVLLEMR